MELDIEWGLEQVRDKTESEVEAESGKKWAAQSAAAFMLSTQADNMGDKLSYLIRAFDLRHESVEHLGLSENLELAKEVQLELDKYKDEAIESLAEFLKNS